MSTQPQREPRNWFYLLLNLASIIFVVTALAYAVVPVLEEKATDAGQAPPPSPFREALRRDGWWWLLVLAGAVLVLAFASMGLDRWRQRKSALPSAEPPGRG